MRKTSWFLGNIEITLPTLNLTENLQMAFWKYLEFLLESAPPALLYPVETGK